MDNDRFIIKIIGIIYKQKDKWIIEFLNYGDVIIHSFKYNEL